MAQHLEHPLRHERNRHRDQHVFGHPEGARDAEMVADATHAKHMMLRKRSSIS
jgi:hypothetical protein